MSYVPHITYISKPLQTKLLQATDSLVGTGARTHHLLLGLHYSCYQVCMGPMTVHSILPQARQELNGKLEEVNAHLEQQV